MYLEDTNCCALKMLGGVYDEDSAESILDTIHECDHGKMDSFSVIVVTTPEERKLEATLKSIGFKESHVFPRRPRMGPGNLTMWFSVAKDLHSHRKAKRKTTKKTA